VDARVATESDARRVETAIYGLQPTTPGTTLEISGQFGRPPMEKTPRNVMLWNLAREACSELGIEIDESTAGGGSDGNWTSQFCATLDGMGAVGDGAHALTEYISTDHLVERTALLARMLLFPPLQDNQSVEQP
jgi:glutamate carboxypeptidase